jgi:DNA-binding GntR family transcriptional regulator
LSAPAYQRAFDVLRAMIREGRVSPGQKLPPERELCEELGVSRITVRHALRLLGEQGLIDRRRGRGTTVLGEEPAKICLLRSDFAGSLRREAPDVSRRLLSWNSVRPPTEVAETLGLLATEECTLAERLDLAGEEPIAFDRAWIPSDLSGSLNDVILVQLDFLDIWMRREGLSHWYCRATIEALGADDEAVRLLDLEKGAPVISSIDLIRVRGGRAVARFDSIYRGDRFKLVSTIVRGAPDEPHADN